VGFVLVRAVSCTGWSVRVGDEGREIVILYVRDEKTDRDGPADLDWEECVCAPHNPEK
jgi:hypothetical protein